MLALDAVLENAVQFTGDGDRIELSVQRHEREAAIVVADSGLGIPESQLKSVFDRFSGTDPAEAEAHNFGLGLSIVRAVAEAHGGRVTAAQGPLGGAAVTLWLPIHDAAAAAIPAAETAPAHALPRPV